MVAKLLFRVIDPNTPVDKRAVFRELMTQLKVPLLGLKQITVGFNAIVERQEDTDVLLSTKGAETLRKLNLIARIPPQVRARRSLFLRRVDSFVGAHSPVELKNELEAQKPWLKVREVFKIKDYTHVLKIECQELQMADKALEQGLLCFYTKIAGAQIERETYVSLQMCFKCYRYEQHQTSECPEGDIRWCSECGAKDHTYRDCRNQRKQCLNCDGPHRTMAMACKIKKQLMNDKIKKQTEKKESERQRTFASVARTAASAAIAETQRPTRQTIKIDNDAELKVVVSILHAHIHNLVIPGTYRTELNRLLEAQDLPRNDALPDNPDSSEMFDVNISPDLTEDQRKDVLNKTRQAIAQTPHRPTSLERRTNLDKTPPKQPAQTLNTGISTNVMPPPPEPQRIQARTKPDTQQQTTGTDTDEETILARQTECITSAVYAGELDVTLIQRKGDYRHQDLKADDVRRLYLEGKLKYRLDYDSELTSDAFEGMIRQRLVKETCTNIKVVNDEVYKKIRNGRESTPVSTYEKQSKTGRRDGRK